MSTVPPHSQCTWILSAPLCIWSHSVIFVPKTQVPNLLVMLLLVGAVSQHLTRIVHDLCFSKALLTSVCTHFNLCILNALWNMNIGKTVIFVWTILLSKNSPIAVILCVSEGYWEYTLKALEDAWAGYTLEKYTCGNGSLKAVRHTCLQWDGMVYKRFVRVQRHWNSGNLKMWLTNWLTRVGSGDA